MGICLCGPSKMCRGGCHNQTRPDDGSSEDLTAMPLVSKFAVGGATSAEEPVYLPPRADGEWCMHQRF